MEVRLSPCLELERHLSVPAPEAQRDPTRLVLSAHPRPARPKHCGKERYRICRQWIVHLKHRPPKISGFKTWEFLRLVSTPDNKALVGAPVMLPAPAGPPAPARPLAPAR